MTPAPSLLMRVAMSEARVVMDPAGNSKLAKATEGNRRLRARDDAAAAAILAVASGARQPEAPPRRWRISRGGVTTGAARKRHPEQRAMGASSQGREGPGEVALRALRAPWPPGGPPPDPA